MGTAGSSTAEERANVTDVVDETLPTCPCRKPKTILRLCQLNGNCRASPGAAASQPLLHRLLMKLPSASLESGEGALTAWGLSAGRCGGIGLCVAVDAIERFFVAYHKAMMGPAIASWRTGSSENVQVLRVGPPWTSLSA